MPYDDLGEDELPTAFDPYEPTYKAAERQDMQPEYPEPEQVQIDIDSEEDYQLYRKHMQRLQEALDCEVLAMEVPSKSGLPHRHITVTFDVELSDWQRIAIAAVLGSDRKRELLNVMNKLRKNPDHSICLFKPRSS